MQRKCPTCSRRCCRDAHVSRKHSRWKAASPSSQGSDQSVLCGQRESGSGSGGARSTTGRPHTETEGGSLGHGPRPAAPRSRPGKQHAPSQGLPPPRRTAPLPRAPRCPSPPARPTAPAGRAAAAPWRRRQRRLSRDSGGRRSPCGAMAGKGRRGPRRLRIPRGEGSAVLPWLGAHPGGSFS